MKILSLQPFFTDLVSSYGLEQSLVCVSPSCVMPESNANLPRLRQDSVVGPKSDISVLKQIAPTHILMSAPSVEDGGIDPKKIQEQLRSHLGPELKVISYFPKRLDDIFEMFEALGRTLGAPDKGLMVKQRVKAQIMDWCDNFYDRMKNKKVTFLSSIEPFELGGWWIPDLISLTSCISQETKKGAPPREVSWEEVKAFRPDVIVVSPHGSDLSESVKTFQYLVKLPGWEEIPAVKRGEVTFAEGKELFHVPSPRLVGAMGILISAIAGFDSGYITPRDSFYRLRYVELQRHKLGM